MEKLETLKRLVYNLVNASIAATELGNRKLSFELNTEAKLALDAIEEIETIDKYENERTLQIEEDEYNKKLKEIMEIKL
jgi:hypothetical protein